MALRRVFSQDSDFQERMFARQIAVMKGQAWNVLETLKQRDHGPLELTRRTRVCIKDDIVEVPVAIPMRASSVEARRRRDAEAATGVYDEMDISAANGAPAAKYQADLMDMGSASMELPNPNRFDFPASVDRDNGPESPATVQGVNLDHSTELRNSTEFSERPSAGRSRTRMSFDTPSRAYGALNGNHRRRYSYSLKHGAGGFFTSDGDDLEGDLGYAAAEGMERNQRKVIVERIEPVSSRNPVFTWC